MDTWTNTKEPNMHRDRKKLLALAIPCRHPPPCTTHPCNKALRQLARSVRRTCAHRHSTQQQEQVFIKAAWSCLQASQNHPPCSKRRQTATDGVGSITKGCTVGAKHGQSGGLSVTRPMSGLPLQQPETQTDSACCLASVDTMQLTSTVYADNSHLPHASCWQPLPEPFDCSKLLPLHSNHLNKTAMAGAMYHM